MTTESNTLVRLSIAIFVSSASLLLGISIIFLSICTEKIFSEKEKRATLRPSRSDTVIILQYAWCRNGSQAGRQQ